MSVFAIYNYEFEPIQKRWAEAALDGMGEVLMQASESFPKKQEIFGELLQRDFRKDKREDVIRFSIKQSDREYIHRHLMPPTDDIIIMRVANKKTHKIIDEELREKRVDDYQNCIVIIDNRPGIQRILIEQKKAAFTDTKQTANILEQTFNRLLSRWSLAVKLYHLKDKRSFWQFANDLHTFPGGFHRVCFYLPYPNLDRLFSQAQRSFASRMNMELHNPKGQVRLDENDPYQSEAIGWFMEDAGGTVKLYPVNSKKNPIIIGQDSFRTVTVSDTVIRRVTEDAAGNSLFESPALDEVKQKTKTGIDI